MSVYDYLSQEHVERIIMIIQNACEVVHREDMNDRMRIDANIYEALIKCRRANEITLEIYISLFDNQRRIDGMEVKLVQNGAYSQPEMTTDRAILHIYHKSNKLDSSLVVNTRERARNEEKTFICLKYHPDSTSRLKKVSALIYTENGMEQEILYEAPRVRAMAG